MGRKSFGNSFALPRAVTGTEELAPILMQLVTKTGARMRQAGYRAQGVHVALVFRSGGFWHRGVTVSKKLFDSREIYKEMYKLLQDSPTSFTLGSSLRTPPMAGKLESANCKAIRGFKILAACPYRKPVAILAESVFNLSKNREEQLEIFDEAGKRRRLVEAVDKMNGRWGDFVVTPGRILSGNVRIIDRIAFGGVKGMEERIMGQSSEAIRDERVGI